MPVAQPHMILAAYNVGRSEATPASSQPSRSGRFEPITSHRRPMYLDRGTVIMGPEMSVEYFTNFHTVFKLSMAPKVAR